MLENLTNCRKNDDGSPYVPPLPERCDFQPIEVITNAERREWKTKREELKRKGKPFTPDKIQEAIEQDKANKRARGERVPGLASVSFAEASVIAGEFQNMGKLSLKRLLG